MVLLSLQLGVVQTESGRVQGQNILLAGSRSVDVFKGIPFADKPGIFEKPKPHPGWDGKRISISTIIDRKGKPRAISPPPGVLQATEFAEPCLQINNPQTAILGSEDCLHLNIWVPHGKDGTLF